MAKNIARKSVNAVNFDGIGEAFGGLSTGLGELVSGKNKHQTEQTRLQTRGNLHIHCVDATQTLVEAVFQYATTSVTAREATAQAREITAQKNKELEVEDRKHERETSMKQKIAQNESEIRRETIHSNSAHSNKEHEIKMKELDLKEKDKEDKRRILDKILEKEVSQENLFELLKKY